jgi:hypothetical protein
MMGRHFPWTSHKVSRQRSMHSVDQKSRFPMRRGAGNRFLATMLNRPRGEMLRSSHTFSLVSRFKLRVIDKALIVLVLGLAQWVYLFARESHEKCRQTMPRPRKRCRHGKEVAILEGARLFQQPHQRVGRLTLAQRFMRGARVSKEKNVPALRDVEKMK